MTSFHLTSEEFVEINDTGKWGGDKIMYQISFTANI